VELEGDPVGPFGEDTIVERGPATGGVIPVELVELSLKSVAPLVVGTAQYDVKVELDPQQISQGTLRNFTQCSPDSATGGMFDSFFDVFTEVTLRNRQTGVESVIPVRDDLFGPSIPYCPQAPWRHPTPGLPFYPGVTCDVPGWPPLPVPLPHVGPHREVRPPQLPAPCDIGNGLDLWVTPPGGAHWAIPVPGATGEVVYRGKPLSDPGWYGADTVISRTSNADGTIDVEIIALSLESVAPVRVGTAFYDVSVKLDPARPSVGQITDLQCTHPNGGTFDSFFDIFVEISLRNTSTGVVTNVLSPAGGDHLESDDGDWCRQPYPDTPVPPFGNFFPGVECAGPFPVPIRPPHVGPHSTVVPLGVIPLPPVPLLAFAGAGVLCAGLAFAGARRLRRRQVS
jgi:hypothetical protein